MKEYFFMNTNYDEVYSYMNKENIPSRRIAEKNGMKFVEEYSDGEENLVVYKITRSEYENN